MCSSRASQWTSSTEPDHTGLQLMTLQRVLRSMREGKVSALTSSWADKHSTSKEQRVVGTKELIKSAVIWVRHEPRIEARSACAPPS